MSFDISPHSVRPLVNKILQHGRIINVVGKEWPSTAIVDTELLSTLKQLGATLIYNDHNDCPQMDVTLILRPKQGLHWNHCDTVTLIMLPEQADWLAIQDNRDPFEHTIDNFQWIDSEQRMERVTRSHNPPAVLIDSNHPNAMTVEDLHKYHMNTVISLEPVLLKHWHRICFVYAGANRDWCIDRVPFETVVRYIEKELTAGKDKVIFVNSDEAVLPHSVSKCHRVMRYFGDLDPDTWFYVTGSINGEETYNNFCDFIEYTGTRMNIISGYRFESVAKSTVLPDEVSLSVEDLAVRRCTLRAISSEPRLRPKKFVCFNRMTRWHRVQLLSFCLHHDLVKDSFYSFDLDTADDGYQDRNVWDETIDNESFDGNYLKGWLQSWPFSRSIYNNWHLFPLVLNRTQERENPVQICGEDIKYHTDSYFSVVPETMFHKSLGQPGTPTSMSHTDGVFVSEKIYKPIAYKHPFIVASTPGYLRQMKMIGYKTFHPFIDESYDLIQDDRERMLALCVQIKMLCNKSDEEILQFQRDVQHIVEHNLEVFLDDSKSLSTTQINVAEKFN